MSAHTPAPWRVDDDDSTLRVRQVNGPWLCVAIVTGGVDAADLDTPQGVVYRANADLLAAAPDLLAALIAADAELLLACGSPLRRQIDAALAKAQGRTA